MLPPNLKNRLSQFFGAGTPRPTTTLSKARCGERLRIVGMRSASPACLRLKELGFCESAEVCKVIDGSALICQLRGVRLAIARDLGAEVMVERMVS